MAGGERAFIPLGVFPSPPFTVEENFLMALGNLPSFCGNAFVEPGNAACLCTGWSLGLVGQKSLKQKPVMHAVHTCHSNQVTRSTRSADEQLLANHKGFRVCELCEDGQAVAGDAYLESCQLPQSPLPDPNPRPDKPIQLVLRRTRLKGSQNLRPGRRSFSQSTCLSWTWPLRSCLQLSVSIQLSPGISAFLSDTRTSSVLDVSAPTDQSSRRYPATDLLGLLRYPSEPSPRRSHLRRRREPSVEHPNIPESSSGSSGLGNSEGRRISQEQTSNHGQSEHPLSKRRRLADGNMKPDGATSTSSANGFSPISNGTGGTPLRKAISNSLNGQSSNSSSQAPSQTNGSTAMSTSPTYYGHDREEVTRILIQSLYDLGYPDAAVTLSRESKYELESPAVAAFRTSVLEGRWFDAESILINSFLEHEAEGKYAFKQPQHDGLVLAEDADKNEMLFCLRQQKFLELLDQRDFASALMVLRQELTPLNHDIGRLHSLSSLLMCPPENLRIQAGLEDSITNSRRNLLAQLSRYISPSVMIPEHRLATLLHQVKQTQINHCLYHNTAITPSLYCDHMCDRSRFPKHPTLELSQHTDEVWYLEFSHDGTKLATASRDRSVIIYDVRTFSVIHKLSNHDGPVAFAAWSPDDTKLISCSQDYKARVWNVETGRCSLTIDHHHEPVTSAAWAPDGKTFVTCSLDNQSQLCLWNVRGDALHRWPGAARIRDCAISADGKRLVAISADKSIHVYNFQTREEEYSMLLKLDVTCINISRDSKYMLVNMSQGEVQLLDLETAEVVRHYSGQKQGQYIIRSTFGGAAENFVVSGSEDSKVYIWHKENCKLVETLEGHSKGCVNAVAWNPKDPEMFASAGDDRKVKIWTNGQIETSSKSHVSSNGSAHSSAIGLTLSRSSSTR
ncbi:conserved hypothetical protein [Uncinocarpus reesii 1704]|uniref:CTLH domain-containing protein n=1 Tax=Uncinocarpus reesii (strain UAMH 1704) TaxID=336963 RepID=C4JMB0_UNCRE|nr:uncharacterized protein UREG_03968 [Uncinocarpus reesii 1704]EEP79122.1 conserved hypothetical protein [Uncinocarpus reesii 1704]